MQRRQLLVNLVVPLQFLGVDSQSQKDVETALIGSLVLQKVHAETALLEEEDRWGLLISHGRAPGLDRQQTTMYLSKFRSLLNNQTGPQLQRLPRKIHGLPKPIITFVLTDQSSLGGTGAW